MLCLPVFVHLSSPINFFIVVLQSVIWGTVFIPLPICGTDRTDYVSVSNFSFLSESVKCV